jgi:hypothetical protein
MKSLFAPVLLALASSFLGSCAHPDAGLYGSRRGEMLRISRSGHLEWSQPSKTLSEFESVGVLARPDDQRNRHLVMASGNPRLGTSVEFSPDGKLIEVTWRSFQNRPLPDRETHYRKSESRSKLD